MEHSYTKTFFLVFIFIIFALVARGWYAIYVQNDFKIRTYLSCDPYSTVCFEFEEEYYTYGVLGAADFERCTEEDGCDLVCEEPGVCEIEECTEEALAEGESCSLILEEEQAEEESDEGIEEVGEEESLEPSVKIGL